MHDEAELSSIATQLEDLATRVAAMAKRHDGSDTEDVAVRLYELERTLVSAGRRVLAVSRILP